ncbi:MAG TPA: peptide-methionine (S)-S-oxide reductase MsrA [Tepidisphaeraceae bacterium]|jgi:peptide-methionine (S)-S-oxide reductase
MQQHVNSWLGLILVALVAAPLACTKSSNVRAADVPAPKVDLPAPDKDKKEPRTLVLAGGCFWCVEAVFESLDGVSDVTSGYAGGTKEDADYHKVSAGETGHAESVKISYDPNKISYGQLLQVFFTIFDPTTKDYQGPDHGHQYRTAIFYADDEQKKVTEAYIQQLADAKVFEKPIVTTLEPLKEFYPAEEYHQNYVKNHPDDPYVRQWAVPKLKHVAEAFPKLMKGKE